MALVSIRGGWIDVNPYLLELLGYQKQELLSRTFQDITHPDDLDADLALIAKVLNGDLETYKLEKRYFHKAGHIVWALLTVSLVRNESGMPRFFVVQIEDITATKNLVLELKLKNSLLSQTAADLENKIQQFDEFNRMVAHNLRGPAGGIEAMLNMAIEEENPVEKEEMLRLLLGSSQSMNATLKDLMEILEIRLNQAIEYTECALEDITKTTIQMLQGEILRSGAIIHTNFSVAHVRFPKVYVESLFYNMISNSLKYKRDGLPVEITISSQAENGRVKITFEDNGLGIDLKRHAGNMFKLNKTFHTGYDSKGVGLFITKNQLETHGGSVAVESVLGVGTKFIVHI
jgi:PAS domain S-box-containing protein